jgi:hypothetical protein
VREERRKEWLAGNPGLELFFLLETKTNVLGISTVLIPADADTKHLPWYARRGIEQISGVSFIRKLVSNYLGASTTG